MTTPPVPSLLAAVGAACADLIKEAGTAYLRGRLVRVAADLAARVDPMPIGDAPSPVQSCPYCAIAKPLAVARMWLTRVGDKPDFCRYYQRLARLAVKEAAVNAEHLTDSPKPYTIKLIALLTQLDMDLARPMPPEVLLALAQRAESACAVALTCAEWYNGSVKEAPVIIDVETTPDKE